MAEHKFGVDLSGLELSEHDRNRIAGAVQRAALSELAVLSESRGVGARLGIETNINHLINGRQIMLAVQGFGEGKAG